MEAQVVRWSYRLGLGCFVVAVVWKALTALSIAIPEPMMRGAVYLSTFYKAGTMFLLICIAAASYTWHEKQSKS